MTSHPSRLKLAVLALVAVVVSIGAVPIGYRVWAYNGWMEYRLICWSGRVGYLEIFSPATPALQDAIDEYFIRMASFRADGDNQYYRDGKQFYMRPWYYLHMLEHSTKNTRQIVNRALGASFADAYLEDSGAYGCRAIFENPKLFNSDPNIDYPTDYIYSQDYLSTLSTIAPSLPPP